MASAPAIHNIPAGAHFLAQLAEGILERWGRDPQTLAGITVLLPTRRACRALSEAFLQSANGAPLLLPRIQPLGDVDEDELLLQGLVQNDALPMPALQRQCLLARLVLASPLAGGDPATALRLAKSLGDLLDSAATEEISLEALTGLVPADLAEHWQKTLTFLDVIRSHWPQHKAANGLLDPAEHRARRMQDWIDLWTRQPPQQPVIAAGSTGTIPATARLLHLIARLPQGIVILPGLDTEADDGTWAEIKAEPTHPQHALALLLDRLGVTRGDVRDWRETHPVDAVILARARLLREALLPPAETARWGKLPPVDNRAFDGLRRLEAIGPREEALAIALIMREALETPGKTAALITPDRQLARRVSLELLRFGIRVDDSAGSPLQQTTPAIFLRLLVDTVAEEFDALRLLALLKHPFCRLGMPRAQLLRLTRRLERSALRGAQPGSGLDAIAGRIADNTALLDFFATFRAAVAPLHGLLQAETATLPDLLACTLAVAETLARGEKADDGSPLWQREAGEALHGLMVDLLAAGHELKPIKPEHWPRVLEALLEGPAVRPRWGGHPRLSILGLLEARLLQADCVILGSLNEGSWPPQAQEDPWMNRLMREKLGLPSPERRLGQTAHDFVQAASAREIVLSRAVKAEGTHTVPARWLSRLAARLGADHPGWTAALQLPHARWAETLDQPKDRPPRDARPRPTPPVHARPRKLSVTQVETWIRDPYAIYARHILRLEVLEPIGLKADARVRGTAIHDALEKFLRDHPDRLPPLENALTELTEAGAAKFAQWMYQPDVQVLWWPRFQRAMRWFIAFEQARRDGGARPVLLEEKGRLELQSPGGPFVLTAKADRIDRLADGSLAILDYKTGKPPTPSQVAAGLAPQLVLEGAIARMGGFPRLPAAPIGELLYIRLRGGRKPGEENRIEGRDIPPADELSVQALAGLKSWVERFDRPEMPYLSRPRPQFVQYAGPYDHLARVREWLDQESEG